MAVNSLNIIHNIGLNFIIINRIYQTLIKKFTSRILMVILFIGLSACTEEARSRLNMSYDEKIQRMMTPYVPPNAETQSIGFVETLRQQRVMGTVRLEAVDGKPVLNRSFMPESQLKTAYDAGSKVVNQPVGQPVDFIAVPSGQRSLMVKYSPGLSMETFFGATALHIVTVDALIRSGHRYRIWAEERESRTARIWIQDIDTGETIASALLN